MITCKFSTAALGLPGRFMISTSPRMPASPRDSMACWLNFRLSKRMASARPGASRSITRRVASGVTSRGAKPVPPVVRMISRPPSSAQADRVLRRSGNSSGRMAVRSTFQPWAVTSSASAGPERSGRSPRAARSEEVRMPKRRTIFLYNSLL